MKTVYIEMTVNDAITYVMYQGLDTDVAVALASELGTNVTVIDQSTFDFKNQKLNQAREKNVIN